MVVKVMRECVELGLVGQLTGEGFLGVVDNLFH